MNPAWVALATTAVWVLLSALVAWWFLRDLPEPAVPPAPPAPPAAWIRDLYDGTR